MNAAAEGVMREISDLVLAYGVSDEFRYVVLMIEVAGLRPSCGICLAHDSDHSFIFHKGCNLFERRERYVPGGTHIPISLFIFFFFQPNSADFLLSDMLRQAS